MLSGLESCVSCLPALLFIVVRRWGVFSLLFLACGHGRFEKSALRQPLSTLRLAFSRLDGLRAHPVRVAFVVALAWLCLNLDHHPARHGLHDRDFGGRTFVLCDARRSYRITKVVKAPA